MNKSKKVTIRDIAREANTSIATVSYVISDKHFVSRKLKDKVNKIISKYNYRKNIAASSLRKKITKMIGIIIHDAENPIFAFINRKIERLAYKAGYSVVICESELDYKKEVEYIDILSSRNVDGLIWYPLKEDKGSYKNMINSNIPIVFIERQLEDINADFIICDHYNSTIDAVDYLAKLGYKKIAYMNRESHLFISKMRFKGFLDGLKKNNLELDQDLIIDNGGYSVEDGYKEMERFINMKNRLTALLAYNDTLAMGAIRAINDNSLEVPGNFSVVGTDGAFFANYYNPRLTTIELKKEEIAQNAFNLLLNRMNGDNSKIRKIVLPMKLVVRRSTGKPKV